MTSEELLKEFQDKLLIKLVDLPALDLNFSLENDKIALTIKRKVLTPDQVSINTSKFFVKSFELPSQDPKLVKLREDYFRELEALENRKGGCKPCDKGKLMRKYIPLVSPYYDK
jgi:hypothetical protein